ncbi:MAG TPA: hypothetical protein VGP44_11845 [Gemmatimonadales bacterium]|nr:hypothetical protein [Gemmatimonadales bacterium]
MMGVYVRSALGYPTVCPYVGLYEVAAYAWGLTVVLLELWVIGAGFGLVVLAERWWTRRRS